MAILNEIEKSPHASLEELAAIRDVLKDIRDAAVEADEALSRFATCEDDVLNGLRLRAAYLREIAESVE